jgi:tetratricopeptide (TPR) repeat protein
LERRDVHHPTKVVAIMAIVVATIGAAAEEWNDCDSLWLDRRIASCTKLIETPGIDPARLAGAFARRGFSYLKLGQYKRAIHDYDEAIRISPRFAAALNNRAMAYLWLGKPAQGMPDVAKALEIAPRVPHFNATRGQISQSLGDQQGAIRDHNAAMAVGGTPWVKLYQCGLKLAQLYHGPIDGIVHPELRTAIRLCVDKGSNCDPLPPDLECSEPVG